MDNNIISVRLWNMEVGLLYWDSTKHRSIFTFNEDFLERHLDIAPFAAPIEGLLKRQNFAIEGSRDKSYSGLPTFIADSLPDKWGNQLFKQWAKEQGIRSRDLTPIDRLSFIGKRGMGALEFHPAHVQDEASFEVNIDSLYRLAEQIFKEREQVNFTVEEVKSLQNLYRVGTSAGGRRPKALIAINEKTGVVRSGQVELPEDFSYFLLKFDESDAFPFTAVEYAYYLMAIDAGITMMPSQLIEVEGASHFLTKRFDRKEGRKIHTQTVAAMSSMADSYEDIFSIARRLRLSSGEITELYRRTVFNILAANVDDHNKNFSFMMDVDGIWHLTPAYDMTFTVDLSAPSYVNRHEFTLGGKVDSFTLGDLKHLAEIEGIKDYKNIIEQVSTAIGNFRTYADKAQITKEWVNRIDNYLSELI